MLANAARRQVHQLAQRLLELRLFHIRPGSMQLHIDGERMCHADRVADLYRAALREAGRHHVFRQIARRIGCTAIDLGRILAGERATAMRRRTAVCVDNDLASGQPAIAVRPPMTKLPVGLM